ncbi:peptidoglycan editing factor PgeF [Sneathiella glossodoripedis]|uniref:peptidoglycan editing factor PgeF n=1 Tax=Sneathiella glossodoripedis TaxID=418853 RepID=UPI000472FA79|nr:peptidoglycan editing factor PgeF [Sneathiella glossodoripedis]
MIIQSEILKDPCVTHGFFTRRGGVSNGVYAGLNCGAGSDDLPENVQKNKKIVCEKLNADKLKTLYQIHSNRVEIITQQSDVLLREKADAMVTRDPGIALGVLTADCVPILFADTDHRVIGAAHSGWKGTLSNIAANVIENMLELGAKKTSICAAIGPAIQQQSYEVGPEFPAPFLEKNQSSEQYFRPSPKEGHFLFDLTALVRDQLLDLGIKQVDLIARDTYANEQDFFSYRRMCHRNEDDYGRQISAIALQG